MITSVLLLLLLQENAAIDTNCKKGDFKLPSMKECRRFLTCENFKDIKIKRTIGSGMSKNVMLAKWKGSTLIYSVPNPNFPDRINDFRHNLQMLQDLQSRHVVQLVGFCDDGVLTEYHPTGTLGDFIENDDRYLQLALPERMMLAIRYVEILTFLHDSPSGTRAMCDSNRIKGTVKQYLVTDDGDIVVNDLDDLRLVQNGEMEGRICGHADFLYSRPDILEEKFLAPEQLDITIGRHSDGKVNITSLPILDEKIDIYKVPAVTAYILGAIPGHNSIMDMLEPIHTACLRKDKRKRPSAAVVKNAYNKILNKL